MSFPRNFEAHRSSVVGIAAALSVLSAAPITAQCSITSCSERGKGSDYAKSLALNALIGGVSAGLIQASNGGSFVRGFSRGALGGGVVFAGKAVAGREFSGAGLTGRQLAGVGNSIVSNTAANQPMLSTIQIYLGPAPGRLFISTQGGLSVRPVVDLATAVATLYGGLTAYLDWGESWSSGAAVFRQSPNRFPRTNVAVQPNRFIAGATTIGGAIFITERGEEFFDELLRHETIHVLQFDAFIAAIGDQSDSWLFARYPSFDQYVKTNFLAGLVGGINQTVFALSDRTKLPWEVEARLFSGN